MTERPSWAGFATRRLLAIPLLVVLQACGTLQPTTGPVAAGHGGTEWRVLERTGSASASVRHGREPVAAVEGASLPAAASLATGPSSQLIVASEGVQVILGPRTRVELPGANGPAHLRHNRGLARYRVAATAAAPLRVVTPTATAETGRGVVDVQVATAQETTVFSAVDGEARVTNRDGTRGVTLLAGQSAEVRERGERLAVRSGPGAPLEPVVPVVLPAASPRIDAVAGPGEAAVRPRTTPAAPAGARSEARARAVAAVAPKPEAATPPAEPAAVTDGHAAPSPDPATPRHEEASPSAGPAASSPAASSPTASSPTASHPAASSPTASHPAASSPTASTPADETAADGTAVRPPRPEPRHSTAPPPSGLVTAPPPSGLVTAPPPSGLAGPAGSGDVVRPVTDKVMIPARFADEAEDEAARADAAGSEPGRPIGPGDPASTSPDGYDLMTRGLLDCLDAAQRSPTGPSGR